MNAIAVGLAPPRDRALAKINDTTRIAHYRLMILMMLFALMIGVIGLRLLYLAIFDSPDRSPVVSSVVPRADITDRNGVVLAATIKGISLAIRPPRIIGDKEKLAVELARLFPTRPVDYYRRVLSGPKKFVYLERGATPAKIHAVRLLGEPAIEEVPEPKRFYPQGTMASQAIGYMDLGGVPVSGMEAFLAKRLTSPANGGQPVALSIDSRVQAAMENALRNQVIKHSAVGGAGIVLDVHTGEIMAMASLPVFNSNAPGLVPVGTDPLRPDARYNRAISSVYELGSTFKMITFANAIEQGVITDFAKRYDATAPLQVGRFKISDDHPENRWMSIPDIMIHSSNIGTARIADELGQARTEAFFRKLGFDRQAELELGARGKPLWPGFWARTTTMTTAYGHGIAVSQLHLANAYAALVNGGIMRPATMLKRNAGNVPRGQRVISEETSRRMRQLMRLVVSHGTGKTGNVPGLRIGGKTGTAEKNLNGRYIHNSLVTTFAGAFPMDAPRYVVIVTMDEPQGIKETYGFRTAAWTALPAVKNIIARIGPMLGVIPDTSKDIDVSDLLPYIYEEQQAQKEKAKEAAANAAD
ncbi:peptidoglycan D,D-transpeptidase FtsI family protein [Sphingomonas sp. SRS2]|uniref:peptidoglycan D,D-transpeptidase FtsI family protein n=1 Tax=Sphingomonas sp. SRS2 TaxID=133190 RepID=UPI0006184B6A|nr:penicillin-binding protein 2 [Sphingomonas sp. SRS2]KKC26781.1 peptidoglycan glycosyltransferase [Sphingomonas sp. SRS2]